MGYGLLAINGDSRTQITTDESYENFVVRTTGTASPGDFTAWGNSQDMLFANGSAGGVMGLSDPTHWSPDMVNTTNYLVGASTSYYTPLPPTQAYGLQLIKGVNDIVFDSRYYASLNFEVVAAGVLPRGGDTTLTVNYGSSGHASADIYCFMNNTKLDLANSSYEINCSYTHQAGQNRVVIKNYVTGYNIGGLGTTLDPVAVFDMTYLIIARRD